MSSRLSFPAGKLPPEFLARELKKFRVLDTSVLIGPAPGEDAAVLSIGKKLIAAAVDPVTFVSDKPGFYVVAVNANDIATRGARPRWFLCSALFPEGRSSPSRIREIFAEVRQACRLFGVSSIGGHTEITSAVNRPVLTGIMLGEALGSKALSTSGVRPGDAIILTKSVALEAASVIAREKRREVELRFGKKFLLRCLGFIHQIGVVKEALAAYQVGGVHAMHDPTEGGISCGLYEMAEASRLRLVLNEEPLPILKETRLLHDFYGLNPLGSLSSGALLIAAAFNRSAQIIRELAQIKIPAALIGRAVRGKPGVFFNGKSSRPFPRFKRDEIARLS